MYSPKVIERNQKALEAKLGHSLTRFSREDSWTWEEFLSKIWDAEKKQPKRHLQPEEKEFIKNERLLSQLDFDYWSRYCRILFDPDLGRGIGLKPIEFSGGQKHLLTHIAAEEEVQAEAFARNESVDGLLFACHKTRQHGLTMLARALTIHRITTSPHTRAIGGSIDDEKVQKIYERDKRILDHLPWYLRPEITFEEKAGHFVFGGLDSSLLYQELVQKAGIAQGEQYEIGHFSEVSAVPFFAVSLENDYQPTIPRAPHSLHILETTPLGRDNWWRFFVEDTRKGGTRWKLAVFPWYVELAKYRRTPPPDWVPSDLAMLHAKNVYESSPEYVGHAVMLPRENLYWWETAREEARRKDSLQWFFTNFWSTIEESFQHTTSSVFNSELLAYYRDHTQMPECYEVRT